MKSKTIAVLNLSETRRDPRVRNVADALAGMGHRAVVVGVRKEVGTPAEKMGGFEILRAPLPRSYTKTRMAEIAKTCPDAGDLIRTLHPDVMDAPGGGRLSHGVHRLRRYLRRTPRRSPKDPAQGSFDPKEEIQRIRVILLWNLALYRQASELSPDAVYCNDLDTLLCGTMLKRNRGIPLVYDAHEIYPEQ
ncbi:MAG: glycosyltransferase, partial [Planctomycetota bacterium]